MSRRFDHEKLEVYQTSLVFIAWLEPILQNLPKSLAVTDQLDRASTSIPLNIAEGNGKFTGQDRCRFFDILKSKSHQRGVRARGRRGEVRVPVDRLPPRPVRPSKKASCNFSLALIFAGCLSRRYAKRAGFLRVLLSIHISHERRACRDPPLV
jgi:hypothetical protein